MYQVIVHADNYMEITVEALPKLDLDDLGEELIGGGFAGNKCHFTYSSEPEQLCQKASVKHSFDCGGFQANAVRIIIAASTEDTMVYEIEIHEEAVTSDDVPFVMQRAEIGFDFVTKIQTITEPRVWTEHPHVMQADQVDVLQNAIPADIENSRKDNYQVVWKPDYKQPIPYGTLMAAVSSQGNRQADDSTQESVMGFMADRGYLDYVLSEKEKSPTRSMVRSEDLVKSIKLLQKFNGFPETGEISKDIVDFVTKSRCGSSDVEYNNVESEMEKDLCFTLIDNGRLLDRMVSPNLFDYLKYQENSISFGQNQNLKSSILILSTVTMHL